MPYWQLFYHLVWATKAREPLLTPEVEAFVYNALRAKAAGPWGSGVRPERDRRPHSHGCLGAAVYGRGHVRGPGQGRSIGQAQPIGHQQGALCLARGIWRLFLRREAPALLCRLCRKAKGTPRGGYHVPVLERLGGEGVRLVREDVLSYGNGVAMPDVDAWGDLPGDLPA